MIRFFLSIPRCITGLNFLALGLVPFVLPFFVYERATAYGIAVFVICVLLFVSSILSIFHRFWTRFCLLESLSIGVSFVFLFAFTVFYRQLERTTNTYVTNKLTDECSHNKSIEVLYDVVLTLFLVKCVPKGYSTTSSCIKDNIVDSAYSYALGGIDRAESVQNFFDCGSPCHSNRQLFINKSHPFRIQPSCSSAIKKYVKDLFYVAQPYLILYAIVLLVIGFIMLSERLYYITKESRQQLSDAQRQLLDRDHEVEQNNNVNGSNNRKTSTRNHLTTPLDQLPSSLRPDIDPSWLKHEEEFASAPVRSGGPNKLNGTSYNNNNNNNNNRFVEEGICSGHSSTIVPTKPADVLRSFDPNQRALKALNPSNTLVVNSLSAPSFNSGSVIGGIPSATSNWGGYPSMQPPPPAPPPPYSSNSSVGVTGRAITRSTRISSPSAPTLDNIMKHSQLDDRDNGEAQE